GLIAPSQNGGRPRLPLERRPARGRWTSRRRSLACESPRESSRTHAPLHRTPLPPLPAVGLDDRLGRAFAGRGPWPLQGGARCDPGEGLAPGAGNPERPLAGEALLRRGAPPGAGRAE